jgi:hypothetical protein
MKPYGLMLFVAAGAGLVLLSMIGSGAHRARTA